MFQRERGEEEKDSNQGGWGMTADLWRLPVSLAFQVVLSPGTSNCVVVFPAALDQPQMSVLKWWWWWWGFALHFWGGRISVRLGQIGSELKITHCGRTQVCHCSVSSLPRGTQSSIVRLPHGQWGEGALPSRYLGCLSPHPCQVALSSGLVGERMGSETRPVKVTHPSWGSCGFKSTSVLFYTKLTTWH